LNFEKIIVSYLPIVYLYGLFLLYNT